LYQLSIMAAICLPECNGARALMAHQATGGSEACGTIMMNLHDYAEEYGRPELERVLRAIHTGRYKPEAFVWVAYVKKDNDTSETVPMRTRAPSRR
jgi:hypothetical protein